MSDFNEDELVNQFSSLPVPHASNPTGDSALKSRLNKLRGREDSQDMNRPMFSPLDTMKQSDSYNYHDSGNSHSLMRDMYSLGMGSAGPSAAMTPYQGGMGASSPNTRKSLSGDPVSGEQSGNFGFYAMDDPQHLMASLKSGAISASSDGRATEEDDSTQASEMAARAEELKIIEEYRALQEAQKAASANQSSKPSAVSGQQPRNPPYQTHQHNRHQTHSTHHTYDDHNYDITSSEDEFDDDDSNDYWDENGYPISRRKWEQRQRQQRAGPNGGGGGTHGTTTHEEFVSGGSAKDIISSVYDQLRVEDANKAIEDAEVAREQAIAEAQRKYHEQQQQAKLAKAQEEDRVRRLQDLNLQRQQILLKQQRLNEDQQIQEPTEKTEAQRQQVGQNHSQQPQTRGPEPKLSSRPTPQYSSYDPLDLEDELELLGSFDIDALLK